MMVKVMYNPLMTVMFSHDIKLPLSFLIHLSHTTSLLYCCADSFFLTTHCCSDYLPIVPIFSCVISFLENLSLGNLRYRSSRWSIMGTGSLVVVSPQLLYLWKSSALLSPHSAVTDKTDLFLEENLLHLICSPPSETYLQIDCIGNLSRGPHYRSLRQLRSCPVIAPTVCLTLVYRQGKPTGAALIKLY